MTFIQSIISAMKNHANDTTKRNNQYSKPLIIVISDERQIYKDMFELNNTIDYISANSKSLSYLFDGIGDVKY